MNEFLKNKMQEEMDKIKKKYESLGYEMTQSEEMFLRQGLSIGVMIAGLALVNDAPCPSDIINDK